MECEFCGKSYGISDEKSEGTKSVNMYKCPRCGPIYIDSDDFDYQYLMQNLNSIQKKILSICLRIEYEKGNRKGNYGDKITANYLHRFLNSFKEMDMLEKMDKTLSILDKKSTDYFGANFSIDADNDYPFFYCFEKKELISQLVLLTESGLIAPRYPKNPHQVLRITAKGYERLRELKKINEDSRQCFVAMWFMDGMDEVFEKAIKPAIEYIEDGQAESRFKALRISDKEHTNDINDEIISEIRRSRFMVCDLTGYRGGVYWEAGFAYGLGLEVIYTCREDWLKTIDNELFDKDGNEVKVKQEGIHFDLEHRNRIQWKMDTPEDLDEFKKKLTNRIKAVIV